MGYRIGAVQTQDIQGDISTALRVIQKAMNRADNEKIDVLCFPECFLQGYTLDSQETKERALNLESPDFKKILSSLRQYKVTTILGVIEKDEERYYNTAAVIRQGKILGIYRKVHLFEHNFHPGKSYPIFTIDGLSFGINICYDARFSEGAIQLSERGAKVIFYPLNNRLPIEKAVSYHDKHVPNLVERAKESGCWVISSDVIAQDSTHTGFGYTTITTPQGKTIDYVPELSGGMIVTEI